MKTTPLSGQPDVVGGFTAETDTIFQAGIENGYRQFITRVSEARKLSPQRVDEIGAGPGVGRRHARGRSAWSIASAG